MNSPSLPHQTHAAPAKQQTVFPSRRSMYHALWSYASTCPCPSLANVRAHPACVGIPASQLPLLLEQFRPALAQLVHSVLRHVRPLLDGLDGNAQGFGNRPLRAEQAQQAGLVYAEALAWHVVSLVVRRTVAHRIIA